MELAIGTKIVYTSAAGTRNAEIVGIKVGPTAKPGFLNTWLTLLYQHRTVLNLILMFKFAVTMLVLKCSRFVSFN